MLLSRNFAPSPALARVVRRHYVFQADLPQDFELIDNHMSETAFIRLLVKGDWHVQLVPGAWHLSGPTPLCGANSRPLPVKVTGPWIVVGIAIRAGAWNALFDVPAHDCVDTMVPLPVLWGDLADRLYHDVVTAPDDDAIVAAIEAVLAERLAVCDHRPIDAIVEAFEAMARSDSTTRVADAAAHFGISIRRFERLCYASFGHSPKTILRRSRFLDMAAAFRGFSEPSAENLAALRYFDNSHRNREFRHFIGMTPGAFEKTPTPLLTAGLKLRADGLN
jgi:AraC-like DNA-binding protein